MSMAKNILSFASCAVAACLLTACSGGSTDSDRVPLDRGTPAAKLALKNFDANCTDFLDYAADGLTEEYLQQFYCLADGLCPVFLESPGPGIDVAAPSSAPDRVSTTNLQEAGVDEADIVKTDSSGHLYIVSGTRLTILDAFPPAGLASRPLVSLNLATSGDAGFFASDLFLDEAQQRVVVLGASYSETGAFATSVLIDVSNPAAPRETARIGSDGYPLEARRIGGRVHRVSRYDVRRPDWLYESGDPLRTQRDAYLDARNANRESEAATIKTQIRAEIGRRVAAAGSASLLPKTFRQTAGQARTSSTLSCNAISRPDVTTGLGVALIDSFNLDGAARATSGVINNAYQVYASATNLYLAQSSAGWFFSPDQSEETVIYRLALSETGAAAYRGLGKVPGSVSDRHSFSEHEGYLRVASSESVFAADGAFSTRNALRVLDASASGEMPIVGTTDNLAPGERIQGVRLLGDRGFIVTFRQVDPLFALDLSDPRRPQVVSELKIPGFSSYLMPIGDDYLLTVGRDGTDEGLSDAVAVQLFDVRDLRDVRQVAAIAPSAGIGGYSYSAAEHDPHAFSYFADSANAAAPGTLTLPLVAYGNGSESSFTGFVVIRVAPGTATPLRETGRMDHEQFLQNQNFCGSGDGFCEAGYGYSDPRRAVYMQSGAETFLYTISSIGVLANSAADPRINLGSHALPYDPGCCFALDAFVGPGTTVSAP